MLNSKKKTYDKKCLQIKRYRYSNDFFALRKCRVLHIVNLTSNDNFSGIKLLMNIMQVSFLLHAFLQYENTKIG